MDKSEGQKARQVNLATQQQFLNCCDSSMSSWHIQAKFPANAEELCICSFILANSSKQDRQASQEARETNFHAANHQITLVAF